MRKLEYILADALNSRADCVITSGGSRSNQTVAAAVCCAKAGLSVHIVLPESAPKVTRSLIALSGACAGAALGTKLYHPKTRATAIAIGRRFTHKETLLRQIHETEALLRCESGIGLEDLHIHFSCGKGADVPSVKGREAMERMAAEGVFLDPYYTGKAFAGLMELARAGTFLPGENVVFIHTGGMVSLLGEIS